MMTAPLNTPSPNYRDHFAENEFKFRWLDALELAKTDLKRTEVFSAYVLAHFMDVHGSCYPSVARIARRMKLSTSAARRAISALEEAGWLIISPRTSDTNFYQAVLPFHGLVALIEDRNKRNVEAPSQKEWERALWQVLNGVCDALSLSLRDMVDEPDWAKVEGRTRQLIQRNGGPRSDLTFLIRRISLEPPTHVRNPLGFLLSRLAQVAKSYSHLKGQRLNWTAKGGAFDDLTMAIGDSMRLDRALKPPLKSPAPPPDPEQTEDLEYALPTVDTRHGQPPSQIHKAL